MKKLTALLLALLMMISAAAAEKQLAGGWTPSADPTVTEELKALFDRGTETLTGAGYIPVAFLGTQVVAGTNYAVLCKASEINKESKWVIVYFYEDLEENLSVLDIADVDWSMK